MQKNLIFLIFQVIPKKVFNTLRIEIPVFEQDKMLSLFCAFWLKKNALSKKLDFYSSYSHLTLNY